MKKPILKNFTNDVLILLSNQKQDGEFDEEVRKILVARFNKLELSYMQVFSKYMKSTGVLKLAYGDVLATHLIKGGYRIEEEIVDELLPNLSIEYIWSLSKSKDDLIREKAREHLFSVLDLYEEKEVDFEKDQSKVIRKEKIIYLKKKEN